jgi:hypothetical protein
VKNDPTGNLGAPMLLVPEIAYRRPDSYRLGHDDAPRKDELAYRDYKKLGIFPLRDGMDTAAAKAYAKDKYGPRARVFATARYWVAYEVQ